MLGLGGSQVMRPVTFCHDSAGESTIRRGLHMRGGPRRGAWKDEVGMMMSVLEMHHGLYPERFLAGNVSPGGREMLQAPLDG